NGLIDPSLDDIMEGPVKFEWVPPANEPSLVPETFGREHATTEVPPPPASGRTTPNCQDDETRNRAQERKNTNFGEASRNNQKSDVSETLRKARATPGESSPKVSHKYGTQEQSSVKLKKTSDLAKLDAPPETSTEQESYELWELRQSAKFHRVASPRGGGDFVGPKEMKKGPQQASNPLDQIPRPKGISRLEELLHKYRDVFPEDLPAQLPPEREISMRIPVQVGSIPPCQAPYRVHEEAKKTVEETLKYLYEHRLARDSFSEYGAPVTLAKKSNGTWRFCTYYRKLNAITKQAKYPLPRVDECLDHLRGAKYFSKLDLRSGYWQVRIHPEDVEKTAFRTHLGHHEWLVVPFGLQGAPSCFQRLMNHYLRAYIGRFVIVYLDDILIYSKTKEEHMEHLERVLKILQEKELYAKGSKCDLFKNKVHFLGFIVEDSQIQTDPEKVKVMRDWKVPETVRELRSFLGLCNFYRKFVQGFSTWAKPLTNILKSTEFEKRYGRPFTKTAPVQLEPKEVEAVNYLKKALTEAPVLVIYDPDKPTEVWADASKENQTVGAALMQDHGRGLQPVAFCSTVMDKHQIHYPTFEQELLALKTAFEEWRHYLLPIFFKARTDHNGLKYLKTQKHLSDRQWQWLGFFNEYQFELVYRPGAKMQVPDALSRRPHTPTELEGLLRVCNADGYNNNDIEITVTTDKGPTKVCFNLETQKGPDPPKLDVHALDYKNDPDFGEIVQTLKTGDSKTLLERPSLQLYLWENDTLYWLDQSQNNRLCVPKKHRVQILKEFHDSPTGGHFGLEKTLSIIRRYFYWPNMKQSVNDYVTTCDLCQKHKVWTHKRYRNPKLPEIPFEPWSTVSIDFCRTFPTTKTGHYEVCAVTCVLTGEAILTPCQSTITAGGTAKLYVDHVFRFKGVPQKLISDRGPQFIAEFWKNFWKLLGTTTALTAPYHPQSNPVERLN
ncbi:MAG: reverse transcriptase domain-containing protein, partial [Cyanobacteriota bacterium]